MASWSLIMLFSFEHLCVIDDSLTGEKAPTWPASPRLGLHCNPRTRWQHEWSGEWEKSLMRSSRAQNLNEWWHWWGYRSKTCYNWSLTFRACHLKLATWIISGLLYFSRALDICLSHIGQVYGFSPRASDAASGTCMKTACIYRVICKSSPNPPKSPSQPHPWPLHSWDVHRDGLHSRTAYTQCWNWSWLTGKRLFGLPSCFIELFCQWVSVTKLIQSARPWARGSRK